MKSVCKKISLISFIAIFGLIILYKIISLAFDYKSSGEFNYFGLIFGLPLLVIIFVICEKMIHSPYKYRDLGFILFITNFVFIIYDVAQTFEYGPNYNYVIFNITLVISILMLILGVLINIWKNKYLYIISFVLNIFLLLVPIIFIFKSNSYILLHIFSILILITIISYYVFGYLNMYIKYKEERFDEKI